MGAEGAAEIVFRHEIDAAADKVYKRDELIELYRKTFANPYVSAGRRLVDDVIEPSQTRRYLAGGAGGAAHEARASSSQKARADTPVRVLGANMDSKSNSADDVTPRTVSIIAAAVTEFLGKTVRIRSVKRLQAPDAVSRWVRQGRTMVQGSHNLGQTRR